MSDWDNYSENLAFDPANSMPRCDIEELKSKVAHLEKMRDITAEYVYKLEEKLRIAEEALEFYAQGKHMDNIIRGNESDNYWHCDGDIENGYRAKEALAKIKEIK